MSLLASSYASALLIQPLSIEALISKADEIVKAKVVSSQYIVENKKHYLETKLRIDESYKGLERKELRLLQFSYKRHGQKKYQLFMNAPRYQVGQRVLLFLQKNQKEIGAQNSYSPVGAGHGVFQFSTKDTSAQGFVSNQFKNQFLFRSLQSEKAKNQIKSLEKQKLYFHKSKTKQEQKLRVEDLKGFIEVLSSGGKS